MKIKIRKGDNVKILKGKDRGKTGKVLRVFPKIKKLIVENRNLVKRHRKARRAGEQSERMTVAAPIVISNVQFICPKCSKPTRVGLKKLKDGGTVRVCKKCEAET